MHVHLDCFAEGEDTGHQGAVWQTAIEWLFQASGTVEQSGKEVDEGSNDHMAIANLNKLSATIPHPLALQASLADTGTECNKRTALCPAKQVLSCKCYTMHQATTSILDPSSHDPLGGTLCRRCTMQALQEKLPGQVANPAIEHNKIKQATTLESLPAHVCPINKSKTDV